MVFKTRAKLEALLEQTAVSVVKDYISLGVPESYFNGMTVKNGKLGWRHLRGTYENGEVQIDMRRYGFLETMQLNLDEGMRAQLRSTVAHEIAHHIISIAKPFPYNPSTVYDVPEEIAVAAIKIDRVADEAMSTFAGYCMSTWNGSPKAREHIERNEMTSLKESQRFFEARQYDGRGFRQYELEEVKEVMRQLGYLIGTAASLRVAEVGMDIKEIAVELMIELPTKNALQVLVALAAAGRKIEPGPKSFFQSFMRGTGISLHSAEALSEVRRKS